MGSVSFFPDADPVGVYQLYLTVVAAAAPGGANGYKGTVVAFAKTVHTFKGDPSFFIQTATFLHAIANTYVIGAIAEAEYGFAGAPEIAPGKLLYTISGRRNGFIILTDGICAKQVIGSCAAASCVRSEST